LSGVTTRDDQGFQAWLAMMDYLVEDDFLVFDVDDMPEDPYSEAGLRIAEAAALRSFATIEDVLAPGNRELYDKFVRFIGQTFVRALGFRWTNVPVTDNGTAYLGIENPAIKTALEVATLLTSAVARRSGDEWAFVFRNMRKRLGAATG
jgi:hypothetical protein